MERSIRRTYLQEYFVNVGGQLGRRFQEKKIMIFRISLSVLKKKTIKGMFGAVQIGLILILT